MMMTRSEKLNSDCYRAEFLCLSPSDCDIRFDCQVDCNLIVILIIICIRRNI